jgi:formyl-CoA transferase
MSITGHPEGLPTKLGVPIGDIAAGMFAAHAILASLFARQVAGEGREIDVALNDGLMALLTFQAGRYFASGTPPGREGNQHPTVAPYGSFTTRDGFLNIAVGSDAQFEKFCQAMEAPELARDRRFAGNADRQQRRQELTQEIELRLRTRSTAEWRRRLEAAGVPAGPIHDLAQAFGDPVAVARGVRVDVDHPVGRIGQVAAPWRLDGDRFTVARRPPLLGEHTAEVLAEVAGYTEEEIGSLMPG